MKHSHKVHKTKTKNQLQLKYKCLLNNGMMAAPDTLGSKLFHNTALR